MKEKGKGFCMLAVLLAMAFTAFGDSEGMSYQGMLADINGTVIQDGLYAMRFTIFNTPTGGPSGGLWQESHGAVQTTHGAFAVELGLSTPFGTLFKDEPMLWLEVEVDRNANGFEASEVYAPRVSLSAAPYVLSAEPYTDENAVAAMGVKDDANPLNHDRYTDAEAVEAMGAKDDANPLNHDRFTNAEVSANSDVAGNTAFRDVVGRILQKYPSSHPLFGSTYENIDFDLTRHNNGISMTYDPGTQKFNASESGYYEISFQMLARTTASWGVVDIFSDAGLVYSFYITQSNWIPMSSSITIYLNAGQGFWIQGQNSHLEANRTMLTVQRIR